MDRGQLVAPPMWAVDTDFSALPPPHRISRRHGSTGWPSHGPESAKLCVLPEAILPSAAPPAPSVPALPAPPTHTGATFPPWPGAAASGTPHPLPALNWPV